jgi:uncharacterized integral membrane protein (TIGR00698 family)
VLRRRHELIVLTAAVVVLTPLGSPLAALGLGIGLGLAGVRPWSDRLGSWARRLLQVSIVGLGFGVPIGRVWAAGRAGLGYTAVSVTATLVAGLLTARLLRLARSDALLVSSGTAICGGSAVATLAPLVRATPQQLSFTLALVFVLNAVALVVFPLVGAALGMSQAEFGVWAALAIHDTSSVVAACARYGPEAVAVGTTVKLVRTLWLVPLALLVATIGHRGTRIEWPWFIVAFVGASTVASALPAGEAAYSALAGAARLTLRLTLLLIGLQVSREAITRAGARLFAHGVVLWLIVAAGVLVAVRSGLLAL